MASLTETFRRHRRSYCSEQHRNPNTENILQTSPPRKDQTNRILVYAGAFNPPHTSHLRVLQHALESNPDLNIVAAIIRPKEDDYLAEKNVSTGRSLILTNEQRAELFCKDTSVAACAWACSSPRIADQLEKDLVREAAKKGLEIRLVSLVGPGSRKAAKPPVCDSSSATPEGRRSGTLVEVLLGMPLATPHGKELILQKWRGTECRPRRRRLSGIRIVQGRC